jgi:S1-C subfamily serine protease
MGFEERTRQAVSKVGPSVVRVRFGRGHRSSLASGIAWGEDRVITAAHAVPREGTGRVRLVDGRELDAEVRGRDRWTGVALLSVGGAAPARPPFRDPSTLAVGEPVLALGRPGRSVRASLRIVGALGDEVRTHGGGRIARWIESDRGFPRGFEGGPLVDLDGAVVGMNTAAIVRGADLAIPETTLRESIDALEQHGGARRGYLGVAVQTVRLPDGVRANKAKDPPDTGVIVLEVAADGPAAKAGVLLGDVILAIDDSPTGDPGALASALGARVDAAVSLSVLRGGAVTELSATTGARVG